MSELRLFSVWAIIAGGAASLLNTFAPVVHGGDPNGFALRMMLSVGCLSVIFAGARRR